MNNLLCFVLGMFIGCGAGVVCASWIVAAHRADDQLEQLMKKRQEAESEADD